MKSPRSIVLLLCCFLAVPTFAAPSKVAAAKRLKKQTAEARVLQALSGELTKSLEIGAEAHECNQTTAITCGQTVSGALSTSDCRLEDQTYFDVWTFSGTAGQQVRITMDSTAVEPWLLLDDPTGETMVQDGAGPDETTATIVYTLPRSGTWRILANSFDSDPATGNYTLSLNCGSCTTVPTSISCNTTRSGSLANTDCTLPSNTYYDEWTFSGTAGQDVRINMRADGTLDTYLSLIDPNGNEAETNDDSAGSTDSEIVHTLDSTGTWRIHATSFFSLATGGYSLQLQCTGGNAACQTGGNQLCLNNARFKVTVNWRDFDGNTGSGHAVGLTNDTGYFWFFNDANVELVIKVLDATTVNNRFWVYYGALTNVEYTMTITDTLRGTVKTYTNPSGTFASAGDVNAFAP